MKAKKVRKKRTTVSDIQKQVILLNDVLSKRIRSIEKEIELNLDTVNVRQNNMERAQSLIECSQTEVLDSVSRANRNNTKLWAKVIPLVSYDRKRKKKNKRGLLRRVAYGIYSSTRYALRRLV